MPPSTLEQTQIIPRHWAASVAHRATTALAPDLVNRAAARLETLAWLYAFMFFMAAFVPALFITAERTTLFSSTLYWAPGVLSIAVAVAVALAIRVARLPPAAVVLLALAFEVVSSYGIAASEFLYPTGMNANQSWVGLSWVAVWTLLFNIVVPTPPRYAVVAALVSVTSVPTMVLLSLSLFPPDSPPDGLMIFRAFGFPYLLTVIMAYVGARVVHGLSREVTRARELGSYQLEDRLGAGGMGEVWRASHRLLARPAAIKLIRSPVPGMGPDISDAARQRFEREAQVIAQLRSPHTVTLFDFGVAQEGSWYYAMELLDGIDADAFVRRFGPMPAERVVYILRQICHSLSEAESHGLVHRDIKPANIFLCRYGEDHDFVKVLDFGLAKAVQDSSSLTQLAITAPDVIQGTPAFIAPEQAFGGPDVDTRADIYSTGCVAYWLLTGKFVFTADTAMKLLLAHAQTPAEPPSLRTEFPIPRDLDAIVLSCLAKDRAHRPQSARELLQRLEAVTLSRPWTEARAREWWTAHFPEEGFRQAETHE